MGLDTCEVLFETQSSLSSNQIHVLLAHRAKTIIKSMPQELNFLSQQNKVTLLGRLLLPTFLGRARKDRAPASARTGYNKIDYDYDLQTTKSRSPTKTLEDDNIESTK